MALEEKGRLGKSERRGEPVVVSTGTLLSTLGLVKRVLESLAADDILDPQ